MRTEYLRVRFTVTLSAILDSFDRGFASIREIIAQHARQGWELESVSERPIGLVDYEVITLMKRAA